MIHPGGVLTGISMIAVILNKLGISTYMYIQTYMYYTYIHYSTFYVHTHI